MRIYIDTCGIQRPLDTKNQLRIILEADSILGLIEFCKGNKADLIASDILRFEIRKCQNVIRREYAQDVLKKAGWMYLLRKKSENVRLSWKDSDSEESTLCIWLLRKRLMPISSAPVMTELLKRQAQ